MIFKNLKGVYHIFVGTYDETSDVAIDIGGYGLETFFEKFIDEIE